MTDMTHEQIRDLLPDVMHAAVDDAHRKQIEEHLRSCSECASEMRVLQMVKDAPSFAPTIDAVKVASVIPPYGGVPEARPRTQLAWQTATLAIAAVALIAVSVIRSNQLGGSGSAASVEQPASPERIAKLIRDTSNHLPSVNVSTPHQTVASAHTSVKQKSHELQVAVGLDELSDGNLRQLASELDGLDGLPAAEPENIDVTTNSGSGGGR